MIISHRLKFAYFRIPKTGSTTAEFMLRLCGAFNDEDIMTSMPTGQFPAVNIISPIAEIRAGRKVPDGYSYGPHMTPQNCVDLGIMTMDQLREYNCYVFLRDPKARHLSGLVHAIGRHSTPSTAHKLMGNTLPELEMHPKSKNTLGLLTIPQSKYIYANGEIVVTALKHNDYQNELRKIIDEVGGICYPLIPKMNARTSWQDTWSPEEFWKKEYIARFEHAYSEDIRLYESLDNWPPVVNPNFGEQEGYVRNF